MKYLSTFILLVAASVTIAQDDNAEQTEQQAEPQQEKQAPIGDRYIRDYIYVPLRSGQSNAHRIVHRGLRTGTKVQLLQENPDTEYSQVRLDNGLEGWIGTQYLQAEPTDSIKLAQAQKTIQRLSQSAGSAGEQLLELEKENRRLTSELEQLNQQYQSQKQELEKIRQLSANAIELDKQNRQLLQDYERLKSRQDTLQAENARLTAELKRDDFLNGAIAVILGILATLVIQYFYRSRKRTDWA